MDRNKTAAMVMPSLAFLFGTVLWALMAVRTRFTLEDAYITFRYSANLISGKGFVFNPGEHVLGTTTPLQTLLLTVLSYPFGPRAVPQVAAVIMPVFGLSAGLVMYLALSKRKVPILAAALGMALLYANVAVIRTGIGGMETPLALLLMAASLWALVSERPVATGILCGLLVLCRIDGLIWVMLIFGATLLKSRKAFLLQGTVFVLTLLPWAVFATLYFGSPVPTSVLAKGVVRPGMAHALSDPMRIMKYARWFASGTGVGWGGWIWLWLPVLAFGAWHALKRGLALMSVYPFAYAVLMYLGRAPRYEWYLLPITFVTIPMAALGLYEAYRALTKRINPKAASYAGAILVIAMGIGYCAQVVPITLHRLETAQDNEDQFRRVVGLWLRDNAPPNALVAMEAIGYQGFFSERRIVDMAGLVTPKAIEYKRRTRRNGQIFNWVLEDFKPDYIVLRSFEVDTNRHFNGGPLFLTPEKESQFHATYREAARFEAPYPDSAPLVRHLTIYQRVHAHDASQGG